MLTNNFRLPASSSSYVSAEYKADLKKILPQSTAEILSLPPTFLMQAYNGLL